MQTENPMIADFVKVLNSAAGTLAGLGREAGETAREKAREVFGGFDYVTREEFAAVKEMAATAREEAEALKARIAALEARLAGTTDQA
ncbi:accessory factor UbiK family protein [Novosphingobium sp. B-7]|uniref:accessory factor UbiK family protein n=1 Tax=Novosphingobium sp. B-7 TaxID=1298855 RepID=UPI0003B65E35|nr:accessory factor UbiK family protein [Novosphingobium sp. B-7]